MANISISVGGIKDDRLLYTPQECEFLMRSLSDEDTSINITIH